MNNQLAAVCRWLRQRLNTSPANAGRSSSTFTVFVCAAATLILAHSLARAQNPYPATALPSQPWGGYSVAQAVPYQPTLTPPATPVAITTAPPPGQAYTLANPIPLPSQPPTIVAPSTSQVWQPYPPGTEAPIGATPSLRCAVS